MTEVSLAREMRGEYPKIRKLGAVSPRGEVSPFVFKGRLMRLELLDPSRGLEATNAAICACVIDAETGRLMLKNVAKLTGKFPRDFELMPGEKFMVVGHKMSNEIQVYRFDRAACTLEPVGEPIAAWRPLCFKFLSEK